MSTTKSQPVTPYSDSVHTDNDPPLFPAMEGSTVSSDKALGSAASAPQPADDIGAPDGGISEDDEAELQKNVRTHLERAEDRKITDREITLLEVQGRELDKMAGGSDGLGKDEYFSIPYFISETERVWHDRKSDDASPESKNTVRLFPNESTILQQKAMREELERERLLQNPDELAMRHPLLFRRMKRNKERRRVFEDELKKHRDGTATGDSLPLSVVSPINGNFSVSRDVASVAASPQRPFSNVPTYGKSQQKSTTPSLPAIKPAASPAPKAKKEDEEQPDGSDDATTTTAVVPADPNAKPTLKELMAQQRTMMSAIEDHNEKVYQPILEACYKFEQHAQQRLTELAGMLEEPKEKAAAES